MFFRLKKSGQRGYIQIVENKRDGAAVRQRVIANLGRADELAASGALASLIASGAKLTDQVLLTHALDEDEGALSVAARRMADRGGNRASSRCRSKRRRFRSTISCSARAARKRAAGQPSLSAVAARARPDQFGAGQSQLAEQQVDAGGVDLDGRLHAASPTLVAI